MAGGIPIAIITLLFKNKYGKCIGLLVICGCNLICLYIALVKAAILGFQKSNDWAIAYLIGVIQDVFVSQIMKNLFKITLFNN
jgi:hypothetical protein